MRITQTGMNRNFQARLNRNFRNVYESNMRMSSQRKYSRVSENTADTARAFEVREQLYRNEQWSINIRNAMGEMATVENTLISTQENIKEIKARIEQAVNGTISDDQRKIIATELKAIRETIIQQANAKFGEKYVFANSGKGDEAPFKIVNGKVQFNGYNVDDIVKQGDKYGIMVKNAQGQDVFEELKYNKDIYIDIGIGMVMSGKGASVELDKKSMLQLSTNGLEAFGFGKDANGRPNNIISKLDNLIAATEGNNIEEMRNFLDDFSNVQDNLLMAITDIGVRNKYLEDVASRSSQESLTLKEVQNQLEGVDLANEMILNKTYEMSWMVTLQMGNKLIPPSIFDYIK